jgi:hypothetical protein
VSIEVALAVERSQEINLLVLGACLHTGGSSGVLGKGLGELAQLQQRGAGIDEQGAFGRLCQLKVGESRPRVA